MDDQTTVVSSKVSLIMAALGTEEATNNSSEVMEGITSSITADKEVATMAEETEIKDDMGTSSSTKMEGGELMAQLNKPDVIEMIEALQAKYNALH